MTKILVIEDEEPIRDLINDILDINDFEVLLAENGQEGVELAITELPDLIICDVLMPKMDGYEVLSQLQDTSATINIPFIFLTAQGTKDNIRQGMNLGADDYLTKPFREEELLQAINIRLKKRNSLIKTYQNKIEETKQKLNQLVYYDQVTHLPNQFALRDIFQVILQEWDGDNNAYLPLLYIGIDRFVRISDTLGHQDSNLLLKSVAQRLVDLVDSQYVIANLDAHNFVIILSPFKTKKEVADFCHTILERFSNPFIVKEKEIFITLSIGIDFCSQGTYNLEELIHNARIAKNKIQSVGGNKFSLYNSDITLNFSSESISLETQLRYAIEKKELEVYYQPQIDVSTGKIVASEALLRWHHEEKGFISPNKFIPIAEQSNLIELIGRWVVKTACEETKILHEMGFNGLKVAINISPRQFNPINSEDKLIEIIEESGINPTLVELELTEGSLVENVTSTIDKLNKLKSIGLIIAIDDFGTGYSSLGYLQQFPFDILKIDRSFVHQIEQDNKKATITKSMISMAHQLGLIVVGEGVETQAEFDFLQKQKCDLIQGYLFSQAVTFSEFENLLKNSPSCRY